MCLRRLVEAGWKPKNSGQEKRDSGRYVDRCNLTPVLRRYPPRQTFTNGGGGSSPESKLGKVPSPGLIPWKESRTGRPNGLHVFHSSGIARAQHFSYFLLIRSCQRIALLRYDMLAWPLVWRKPPFQTGDVRIGHGPNECRASDLSKPPLAPCRRPGLYSGLAWRGIRGQEHDLMISR